ncbi:hypothetical protein JB92DRAFT_3144444 [Gautieria morchelliformis]|nr:hypothetical protein JB92DRAFT_3144444 [Gautieria morchelliformis]
MHPLAILSLASLPALCVSTQVYLHPPPRSPVQSASPALLAHHLGLEAYESLPLGASTGEIVLGGARTFVGEGQRDALLVSVDSRRPDDVIPQAFQPSILSANINSPSSLLEYYSQLSRQVYSSVVTRASTKSSQYPPSRLLDIFALSSESSTSASKALENFLTSLNNLVAFVEESPGEGVAERFGAFEVTGLKDIEEAWGQESEQYMTATAAVKATLQSAAAKGLSIAVISPSHLSARQLPQPPQSPLPPVKKIPDTAPVFSTSTCFSTADACRNATASCSSRGDCVAATRAGRTCFVCECGKAPFEEGGKNISWAGSMCQKKDISQEFTLILGTVIFLILVSVGSIALLYTVGDQELPGTLTSGAGGASKHE